MTEQSTHMISESPVQERRKPRSEAEKVGRLKYTLQLLQDIRRDVREVREVQRIIINGLKGAGYFHFSIPLLQKFACEDIIDQEILERLYEAGREGLFPKYVAADLPEYKLRHWHVSRRILRMNKRLERETGEKLFEKRGHKWALTSFAFEVWGESEKPQNESVSSA